jgi:hypothetical protein
MWNAHGSAFKKKRISSRRRDARVCVVEVCVVTGLSDGEEPRRHTFIINSR